MMRKIGRSLNKIKSKSSGRPAISFNLKGHLISTYTGSCHVTWPMTSLACDFVGLWRCNWFWPWSWSWRLTKFERDRDGKKERKRKRKEGEIERAFFLEDHLKSFWCITSRRLWRYLPVTSSVILGVEDEERITTWKNCREHYRSGGPHLMNFYFHPCPASRRSILWCNWFVMF